MYDQLPLKGTMWLISTARLRNLNLALIRQLEEKEFGGRLALTASSEEEAVELENAGVHLVLRPFADASERTVDAVGNIRKQGAI